MTHPRRLGTARALVASAPDGFLELVLDPDPTGPATGLRTCIRAWTDIPATSTHHLVLEDDAQLPAGFHAALEQVVAAAPDVAIVLYNNWSSRNGAVLRLAALCGARWAEPVAEYTANVALVLPAPVAAGFGDYARAHGGTWPDDVILARYLAASGVRTLLAVPNLVQHGAHPSISGNDKHGLRQSACHGSGAPGAAPALINNQLFISGAVPFFKFGVAQCSTRTASGWLTVSAERAARAIGVDPAVCPDLPTISHVSRRKVEALWRTGYALGVLAARHGLLPNWADDPLVARAIATLGPGGLCMELTAGQLHEIAAPLDALAWSAVTEGTRQAEFTYPGRTVTVAGADCALRRVLAADLTDRGHHVQFDGLADIRVDIEAGADRWTGPVLRCTTPTGTTALRAGVPYGPELREPPVLNELVLRSLLRVPMRAETDMPDRVRFAHVWDIAGALAHVLENRAPAGTFDIGHADPVGPQELAKVIGQHVRDTPVRITRTSSATATTAEMVPLPGLRTGLDLAEGIRTVAQWLAYETDQ